MDKPEKYNGRYQGTDCNGNDHYAADYYIVSEVEDYLEYVEQLEKENAEFHKMIGETDKLARERFAEYRATIQELAEALDEAADIGETEMSKALYMQYKALAAKHLNKCDKSQEGKDEF